MASSLLTTLATGKQCPAGAAARAPSEPATGLAAVRHAHDRRPHLRVVYRVQDAVADASAGAER